MSHKQDKYVIYPDSHPHRKEVEQGYKSYNRENSKPSMSLTLKCTSSTTLIHGCNVDSEIALGGNNLIYHQNCYYLVA